MHKRSIKRKAKFWAKPPEQAWNKAEASGQLHIFEDWESLTLAQKQELIADVEVSILNLTLYPSSVVTYMLHQSK